MNNCERAPIGAVVEGRGEYHSYPTLINKCIGTKGIHVPVVTADGCGGIFKNLDEHLMDLIKSYKPMSIIVTVDLVDAIEQGYASDRQELETKLTDEVSACISFLRNKPNYQPLPSRIECIAQVVKFESWLIADPDGLKKADLIFPDSPEITDVETITNPTKWLKKYSLLSVSVKNPKIAKTFASALCTQNMSSRSRSFSSFKETCLAMHNSWLSQIN